LQEEPPRGEALQQGVAEAVVLLVALPALVWEWVLAAVPVAEPAVEVAEEVAWVLAMPSAALGRGWARAWETVPRP